MLAGLIEDKSTWVQVMAWCRQETQADNDTSGRVRDENTMLPGRGWPPFDVRTLFERCTSIQGQRTSM